MTVIGTSSSILLWHDPAKGARRSIQIASVSSAPSRAQPIAANRFRGGIGIGLRLLHPGAGMTRFDFAWSPEGGFRLHFGGASKMARSRFRIR